MLIIPVFSNEGVPHWTLVAVLRGSEVLYYDSLSQMRKACESNAKVLLELLALGCSGELRRSNVSRQAGVRTYLMPRTINLKLIVNPRPAKG